MFETILIQLGAFSVNVSISIAQLFLGLLIIFSAVKLYKTRDFSQLTTLHAKFFMLMVVAELTAAFAGIDPKRSVGEVASTWTYLYLFTILILLDGNNLNRVLYAFFFGSILNAISGIYDIYVTGIERAIGYYTHALTYGNAAAVVFICGLGLLIFVRHQPKKLYLLTISATVLAAYALFLSGSRGPMLSAIVTTAIICIYQYKMKAVAAVSALVFIVAGVIYFSQPLQDKLFTDRGGPVGTSSSVGTRIVLWETALKGISERPVFGFGKGNFTAYAKENIKVPVLSTAHAHNSYLHYAFSNGLVGLALLFGFIISLFRYMYLRSKEYPPAKAAIFIFIAFLLEGLTENNFGDSEVVMLTTLLLAALTAPARHYKNL